MFYSFSYCLNINSSIRLHVCSKQNLSTVCQIISNAESLRSLFFCCLVLVCTYLTRICFQEYFKTSMLGAPHLPCTIETALHRGKRDNRVLQLMPLVAMCLIPFFLPPASLCGSSCPFWVGITTEAEKALLPSQSSHILPISCLIISSCWVFF